MLLTSKLGNIFQMTQRCVRKEVVPLPQQIWNAWEHLHASNLDCTASSVQSVEAVSSLNDSEKLTRFYQKIKLPNRSVDFVFWTHSLSILLCEKTTFEQISQRWPWGARPTTGEWEAPLSSFSSVGWSCCLDRDGCSWEPSHLVMNTH